MMKPYRVAVFEDDFLLAESLSDVLTALGCELACCCASVPDALLAVETVDFDLAIVDLDLRGQYADPVLDRLAKKNVYALLATAADERDLPDWLQSLPRISKPYNAKVLKRAIQRIFVSSTLV